MSPKEYLNNFHHIEYILHSHKLLLSFISLLIILITSSIISTSSASTIYMGDINENLELCIYRADGTLEGCLSNATNITNITKEDYYMELRPASTTDYFTDPLKIASYFPPIVYIILNFIIIIVVVGGLFVAFKHLLFGKSLSKYSVGIKRILGKPRY